MVMKNYIEESVKFRMGKWYDKKFKRNEFSWDEIEDKNYVYDRSRRWIHFVDQFKNLGCNLNPGVVLSGSDHIQYDRFLKQFGDQIPLGGHNRNRHSKDSILFTLNNTLKNDIFRIHEKNKDRKRWEFEEKKDEIIWRGRFTGRDENGVNLWEVDNIENNINKFLRFRFVEKWSKKYNIKFTKDYDWCGDAYWDDIYAKSEVERTLQSRRTVYNRTYTDNYFEENSHMMADWIPFVHWKAKNPPEVIDEYKYILCLDGHDWSSVLPFILMTSSLMIGPIPKWHNIFHLNLSPWEHYVPVLDDASDLDEKLSWCRNNQNQCLAIIQRANQYITQFNSDSEEEIRKNIIKRLYKNSYK